MKACHAGKSVYRTQGAQDECIKGLRNPPCSLGSPFEVSNKDDLLKGRVYHTIYEKLQYGITVSRNKDPHDNATRTTVCATLAHGQCDLISGVDLVLPNPSFDLYDVVLKRYIHTVEVQFGGMRADMASSPEVLKYQGDIFGRFPSSHGKKMFMPLALAPLHSHNAVMPSTKRHELKIIITFAEGIETVPEFELCANKIFVKPSDRFTELPLDENRYAQLVQRVQYAGGDKIKRGTNRVRLNFNHPTYLIYFWGIDVDKVKRVRLLFDKDEPFFDGTMAELERKKWLAGFGHMPDGVGMIVFSTSSFKEAPSATVNFSRIDMPALEIETEQEESDIHVVAVSTDMLVYTDGMVCMRYSS